MITNSIKPLTQLSSYLKLQGGKINLHDNSFPTRVVNKKTTSGCFNIIQDLISEAKSDLFGCSDLEKAQVRQWIEYTLVYVYQPEAATQVLRELNSVLATKTYLVSHKLTVADIFLYYVLQPTMESLTLLDKEKHINVSRWFDNLQQNPTIRQSNKIVNFSTLYLASLAPARH